MENPILTKMDAYKCLRCGYVWAKRGDRMPILCANVKCHSPYWHRPRLE